MLLLFAYVGLLANKLVSVSVFDDHLLSLVGLHDDVSLLNSSIRCIVINTAVLYNEIKFIKT